ncbi:hypothetical protein PMI35_01143, partial [Pseudomonas sp. GM78]
TAGMDMYSVNKIPIGRQDAFAGKPGSYSKSETIGRRYRTQSC